MKSIDWISTYAGRFQWIILHNGELYLGLGHLKSKYAN
jgi:hypothetical protein